MSYRSHSVTHCFATPKKLHRHHHSTPCTMGKSPQARAIRQSGGKRKGTCPTEVTVVTHCIATPKNLHRYHHSAPWTSADGHQYSVHHNTPWWVPFNTTRVPIMHDGEQCHHNRPKPARNAVWRLSSQHLNTPCANLQACMYMHAYSGRQCTVRTLADANSSILCATQSYAPLSHNSSTPQTSLKSQVLHASLDLTDHHRIDSLYAATQPLGISRPPGSWVWHQPVKYTLPFPHQSKKTNLPSHRTHFTVNQNMPSVPPCATNYPLTDRISAACAMTYDDAGLWECM
jgi:hypothetical protein